MSLDPSPDSGNFLKDAITSGSLGGAGVLARAALSKSKTDWRTFCKQQVVGITTAVFVGFAVKDLVSSEAMRYAIIGFASITAPELLETLIDVVPSVVKNVAAKFTKKG